VPGQPPSFASSSTTKQGRDEILKFIAGELTKAKADASQPSE
jgi:hypothetical protein